MNSGSRQAPLEISLAKPLESPPALPGSIRDMSDPFFKASRPFTKRKREDGPAAASRSGTSRGGSALPRAGRGGSSDGRGRGRGGSRGGSDRGNSRGGRGGRGARGRGSANGANSSGRGKNRDDADEELEGPGMDGNGFDSDSDVDGQDEEELDLSSEEDDDAETPAQKRLRLSQMYLKSLEKDKEADTIGFDAADLDRDIIAERLQQDVLEHTGKLHLNVADTLRLPIEPADIYFTPSRGHRGATTSAAVSEDGSWLFTSSKDGSIIKWDLRAVTSLSGPVASTSASAPARITKAVFFPKRIPESAKRNPELKKKSEASMKGKGKEEPEVGHADEVLDLAVSHDGKVLASGGRDKIIGVWDVAGEGGKWMRGLAGHKDKVAALAFRIGTLQLYSSSFDRTIKLFDLSTLSYIETLFGHQDCIQDLSALRGELAVSAGGRDKTCRFWKVTEESQLVFRGGAASRVRNVLDGGNEEDGIEDEERTRRRRKDKSASKGEVKYVEGSIDVVSMVDDTTFLSGGDSGSICLWSITKKKPIFTLQLAHGVNEYESETEGIIGNPRWVTALACMPYGDVFASGSWDGQIRLWKLDERVRSFSALATIPATGFVNSIQLVAPSMRPRSTSQRVAAAEKDSKKKALVIVAAVSKEPRLGRWMRLKEGREGALVAVVPMSQIVSMAD